MAPSFASLAMTRLPPDPEWTATGGYVDRQPDRTGPDHHPPDRAERLAGRRRTFGLNAGRPLPSSQIAKSQDRNRSI